MKNLSLFLTLAVVFSISSFAQLTNDANGARALGSANASINYSDVWAAHNSISALAEFEGTEVGVGFNNRFGVDGFNTMSIAAAHQLKTGTAALSVKKFGDNLYSESVIGLGYAHKLDFVSLGFKANLLQVAIDEIGSRTAIALEFGGLVHLNEELTVGANIYNINQARVYKDIEDKDFSNDERFSTVLKAGVTYHPFEKLYATIEAEKDIEYKNNVKAGLEYFVIEKLAIRTGFSTLNQLASFGLGLKLNQLSVDYALSYHNQLGVSNGISINYLIKKSNKSLSKVEEEVNDDE